MGNIVLPREKTRVCEELGKYTILLYAPPKFGKSTFASKFPDAIFFECEPGLKGLETYKVAISSWNDLLAACAQIAAGDHGFKTIVIDTIDNAFKLCSEHVNAAHGVVYEGDVPHGKGWAMVKNEWHRVLTRLAGLPYGLVMISHAVEKEIETKVGTYTKIQPTLPERARGVVLALADLVLYGELVATKNKDGEVKISRVLRTKPSPAYEAGDRTGRLPEVLPLDYGALAAAFAQAVRGPQNKGGAS